MDITAPRPSATPTRSGPLDRAVNLTTVNWEVVYFIGLMAVVLLTRLLLLDQGALHHDESIHGYYSYKLFTGGYVYQYDPTYHGPFLYHFVALIFFFFGASDYTVRLGPAIFGIILIGLMWWFRPFLGRWGALAAATFMTFAPDIMYYSRHLRHDIFSTVGTMLMLLGILGFIRSHKARYIYIAALGVGLGVTNHELIYLNGVIFVSFLVFAFLYEQFINRDKPIEQRPLLLAFKSLIAQPVAIGFALLLMFGFIVLFYSSFLTNMGAVGDFVKGITYWGSQQAVARGDQPWYYFFIQLAVYDPILIFFGIVGGFYLIIRQAQHKLYDVAEETDPTPDVQPAPGLPTQHSVVDLMTPLLGYWALGALIVYSIAGEKMPWLTMQISIPLALLGGMALGRMLKNTDWRRFWSGGGVWAILTIILIGFALIAFRDSLAATYTNPAAPTAAEQSQHLLRSLLTAVVIVVMVGLLMFWYGKLGLKHSWLTFVFAIGVVLAVYGIHSAVELNFYNADNPSELQVYVQTSPDVPIVADRIINLSRMETAFTKRNADDPTGGHSLDIAVDNQVEWPWDWYFRDQKGYFYFNAQSPLNKPPSVVISRTEGDVDGQKVVQQVEQTLGGNYIKEKFALRWWFPEELYKNLSNPGNTGFPISQIFSNLTNSANWPSIGNYFFFRKPANPLGSTDFYLYVRADLAAKIGMGGTTLGGQASNPNQPAPGSSPITSTAAITSTGGATPVASGPAHKMLEMSEGKGNGQFESPRAMAAAPDGSFYVLDTENGRVEHFDANGNFLAAFGQPSDADQGSGGASNPDYKPAADGYLGILPKSDGGANGIAVDKQGNVYVADTWYHRIEKFDKDGKFLLSFGQPGYTGGKPEQDANPDNNDRMFGPRGIAVSDTGEIYVTDTGDKRVLVFDQAGKYTRQFGVCKSLGNDASGNEKLDCTGDGALDEPIGIAVNSQTGIVFVADTRNHRIAEFKTDGTWVKSFPVADNGWQSARFMEPQLALDAQGNLYVPDPSSANADVVKYSPDGTKLGSKAKEQGSSLVNPTGIALDSAGNIYVTDPVQQGVVKFSPIQ